MYRSVHGEAVEWGATEHLLATVADRLGILIWHGTADGHKGRNRPKLIPRPGMAEPGSNLKPKARPIAEMRDFLARWNAGELEGYAAKDTKAVT